MQSWSRWHVARSFQKRSTFVSRRVMIWPIDTCKKVTAKVHGGTMKFVTNLTVVDTLTPPTQVPAKAKDKAMLNDGL
jgi:hypothetical protein